MEGLDLSRRCLCTAPRCSTAFCPVPRRGSRPPSPPLGRQRSGKWATAEGTAYPTGLCAAWAANLVVQLLAVGAEPAPTNLAQTAAQAACVGVRVVFGPLVVGPASQPPPQKGKLETSWKPSGSFTCVPPLPDDVSSFPGGAKVICRQARGVGADDRNGSDSEADQGPPLPRRRRVQLIARLIRVPPAPQAGGATHSEADQGSPCPAGGGSPCPAGGECNS